MLHALLLDAAGTLIEPAESVAEVYARATAAHGQALEAARIKEAFRATFSGLADPDWTAHSHGDAAERQWWRQIVGQTLSTAAGRALPDDFVEACFHSLFAHYADPAAWRVFPEVPEVLAAAREADFRLAVVSNFDRRLHGILTGHGLYFDAIVTSADAACRKPGPAIFRHALELLDLSPAEAFHCGDSHAADFLGAQAAGIPAWHLERPAQDLRDFLALALANRSK